MDMPYSLQTTFAIKSVLPSKDYQSVSDRIRELEGEPVPETALYAVCFLYLFHIVYIAHDLRK